jgi:hypothetical protein
VRQLCGDCLAGSGLFQARFDPVGECLLEIVETSFCSATVNIDRIASRFVRFCEQIELDLGFCARRAGRESNPTVVVSRVEDEEIPLRL